MKNLQEIGDVQLGDPELAVLLGEPPLGLSEVHLMKTNQRVGISVAFRSSQFVIGGQTRLVVALDSHRQFFAQAVHFLLALCCLYKCLDEI